MWPRLLTLFWTSHSLSRIYLILEVLFFHPNSLWMIHCTCCITVWASTTCVVKSIHPWQWLQFASCYKTPTTTCNKQTCSSKMDLTAISIKLARCRNFEIRSCIPSLDGSRSWILRRSTKFCASSNSHSSPYHSKWTEKMNMQTLLSPGHSTV